MKFLHRQGKTVHQLASRSDGGSAGDHCDQNDHHDGDGEEEQYLPKIWEDDGDDEGEDGGGKEEEVPPCPHRKMASVNLSLQSGETYDVCRVRGNGMGWYGEVSKTSHNVFW